MEPNHREAIRHRIVGISAGSMRLTGSLMKALHLEQVAMSKTHELRIKFAFLSSVLVVGTVFLTTSEPLFGQHQKSLPPSASATEQPHRTRLILKDGSYQVVMSYR